MKMRSWSVLDFYWPHGLMDKVSDFESENCEFESRRSQGNLVFLMHPR